MVPSPQEENYTCKFTHVNSVFSKRYSWNKFVNHFSSYSSSNGSALYYAHWHRFIFYELVGGITIIFGHFPWLYLLVFIGVTSWNKSALGVCGTMLVICFQGHEMTHLILAAEKNVALRWQSNNLSKICCDNFNNFWFTNKSNCETKK